MNALITIQKAEIGQVKTNAVDARELWKYLESKQHFADWIKAKVIENPFFAENQDYILLQESMKQNGSGGHNRKDYVLTLDTAKKIAMSEQTKRGEQVRDYFIECEKIAQKAQDPYGGKVPRTLPEALRLCANTLEREQIALEQRDYAIRTKAEIGSRREATAMNTASQYSKQNKKLRKALERHDCKTITELLEDTGITARVANIELESQGYLYTEVVNGKKRKRLTEKGEEIAKEFPSKKFVQIGILPDCEELVLDLILGREAA